MLIIYICIFFIYKDGEKIYDGITSPQTFEGDSQTHKLEFSQHIYPTTTYTFLVKLIAPSIEQQLSNENFATKEMESLETNIKCYTRPSKLFGKYQGHNPSRRFFSHSLILR